MSTINLVDIYKNSLFKMSSETLIFQNICCQTDIIKITNRTDKYIMITMT